MAEPDELKSLSRLRPSDDFKTAVHARLRMPEPRPILWPLPMAAAAGILLGVLGTMLFLRPPAAPGVTPVVASSPALTETMRDHAHRTRTFVKQADRAPADLVAADYRISGLGPRTALLLAERAESLPESERMYISIVASPIGEVARLMDDGRPAEAIERLVALRAEPQFDDILFGYEAPEPARTYTLEVGQVDGNEARAFLEARACLYERDYAGASRGFDHFSHRYPESSLADDATFWNGRAALEAGDVDRAVTCLVQVMGKGWIDEGEQRRYRFVLEGFNLDGPERPNVVVPVGPPGHGIRIANMRQILTEWKIETDGEWVTVSGFDEEIEAMLREIEKVYPERLKVAAPHRAAFKRDFWRPDGGMRPEFERLRERIPWHLWMDEDDFEFRIEMDEREMWDRHEHRHPRRDDR